MSRVVTRVPRVVKRESRVVNRLLHEGNNVKRVSRVVKRVQSWFQAHGKKLVKRVSREWQMDVNRESKYVKRVPRGSHDGVKDSKFVRAWASCQEVQCAESQ